DEYMPSSSTHRRHSLVEIDPNPNLYQSIMNPDGCYAPVFSDDRNDDGNDDDGQDEYE
ncbi:hypothetical protein Tco_0647302, partial [Tanacetum coccineum]